MNSTTKSVLWLGSTALMIAIVNGVNHKMTEERYEKNLFEQGVDNFIHVQESGYNINNYPLKDILEDADFTFPAVDFFKDIVRTDFLCKPLGITKTYKDIFVYGVYKHIIRIEAQLYSYPSQENVYLYIYILYILTKQNNSKNYLDTAYFEATDVIFRKCLNQYTYCREFIVEVMRTNFSDEFMLMLIAQQIMVSVSTFPNTEAKIFYFKFLINKLCNTKSPKFFVCYILGCIEELTKVGMEFVNAESISTYFKKRLQRAIYIYNAPINSITTELGRKLYNFCHTFDFSYDVFKYYINIDRKELKYFDLAIPRYKYSITLNFERIIKNRVILADKRRNRLYKSRDHISKEESIINLLYHGLIIINKYSESEYWQYESQALLQIFLLYNDDLEGMSYIRATKTEWIEHIVFNSLNIFAMIKNYLSEINKFTMQITDNCNIFFFHMTTLFYGCSLDNRHAIILRKIINSMIVQDSYDFFKEFGLYLCRSAPRSLLDSPNQDNVKQFISRELLNYDFK